MPAIKLYRHALSGHCHRVEVLLSLLGLRAEVIDVDLMSGAHKQPSFLQKNAFGQVPVLEDGDITLADSNAIISYLALRYDPERRWLPEDPLLAAEVIRFLSLAAGKIANGPATARLITLFGAQLDADDAISTAHATLAVLEQHLKPRDWLVGQQATLADVACYSYIAHAPEGNVSLDGYPQLRDWLARFEQLPGFIPMQASPVGLNV
ncbi:glutathione S-transferase family protein [Marinobacterium jannaschii]|uniref:glutathione S-transferase family protein n=1 Tax=Marinobacterium jannaschii TaxID=64970 RepID=UPI000482AA52|nr:glutathione S-transferase [Marinobacterium jannaschii]